VTRKRGKRIELATALVAVLVVGGCGEQRAAPPPPRLPAALASRLAARSDEVARLLERNDGCAALAAAKELQRETIAAINAGRVPTPLQEPLQGAANDLTARISCVLPPPQEPDKGKQDEHGNGHGKDHGKGKHGHGKGGD
jgi:hypothetical protein